jgi:hypothetical protein
MCQGENEYGVKKSGNAYQAGGSDAIAAAVDDVLDGEKA